jgi:hypothetical protein
LIHVRFKIPLRVHVVRALLGRLDVQLLQERPYVPIVGRRVWSLVLPESGVAPGEPAVSHVQSIVEPVVKPGVLPGRIQVLLIRVVHILGVGEIRVVELDLRLGVHCVGDQHYREEFPGETDVAHCQGECCYRSVDEVVASTCIFELTIVCVSSGLHVGTWVGGARFTLSCSGLLSLSRDCFCWNYANRLLRLALSGHALKLLAP